jgi:hypothetical protein
MMQLVVVPSVADRRILDSGVSATEAVGWVELIRAFTPVFAGYAKPIVFQFKGIRRER